VASKTQVSWAGDGTGSDAIRGDLSALRESRQFNGTVLIAW
jgi:hypothetical protein